MRTNEAVTMLARVAPMLPLTVQTQVERILRDHQGGEDERSGLAWFCVWCLRWTRGHGACGHCGRGGGL